MIDRLSWLALDVANLERAAHFYEEVIGLSRADHAAQGERRYQAGEVGVDLRGPDADHRGGAHVHYAFETGRDGLEEWESRFEANGVVESHDFGVYRSLYTFDPDDHCVEVGGRADGADGITGIFEVVLEVELVDAAEAFYSELGCSVIDRGEERERVRMDAGAFELELWTPQTGIAGAEPGEHVELGLIVDDPSRAVQRATESGARIDGTDDSAVIDPDGHRLVFVDGSD